MADPTAILAAIDACIAASPVPPTSGNLAATVLRAAAELIERLPTGADCADYLEALAVELEAAQQQPAATVKESLTDPQTLHSVALRIVGTLEQLDVLPEILDTLRRAIREPIEQEANATL